MVVFAVAVRTMGNRWPGRSCGALYACVGVVYSTGLWAVASLSMVERTGWYTIGGVPRMVCGCSGSRKSRLAAAVDDACRMLLVNARQCDDVHLVNTLVSIRCLCAVRYDIRNDAAVTSMLF